MSARLVYIYTPYLVSQQSIEPSLIHLEPVKAVIRDQQIFHISKVYYNLQCFIKFRHNTLPATACPPSCNIWFICSSIPHIV